MINILISDDNINLVSLIFKDILRKNNKFRLSDYTFDGENTMLSIIKYKPDVIILDIKMPKKDGISIIEELSILKNEYNPYIIVITSFQEYINKLKNNKNIYALVNKGENFSKISESISRYLNEIDEQLSNKRLFNKIKKEIERFNVNFSNKGTRYLIDSIVLAYYKDDFNMKNDIFPYLSKKYKVSSKNIKWNMEKNIKSIKRYTANNIINEYFNIDDKTNLTVKNVIQTIIDKIKINNKI